MGIQFETELAMEKNLIQQLVTGESQWVYREDLRTESDLWDNFKNKLEQNNKAVLQDIMLTEKEFQQIKTQLQFTSFYAAAVWLAGENGVAKVEVQREDASLGKIRLEVIRRADISGGTSSYEVINQYQSDKKHSDDRNRRFDVSLLINGLPMIHIELKNHKTSYMDAFRQTKKYLKEGKFKGIFSSLQMFVFSNGADTRYIAAAGDTKLKEQFLSGWVDELNQPVNNYLEFADHVLSIPQAHKMVMQNTVIDSKHKSLIMLRPYQIHAIDKIKEASKQQKSGYIWHTTGSGKTLTSYKAARNLLTIPSINKTIFVIDRVDLDQQTSTAFESYAENDVISLEDTDNVNDLVKKLVSNDRQLIVTTIQKLNHVMKRFEGKEETPKGKKLRQLKLAFVVDECHRAVSPQKKQEIDKFFRQSMWFGFTGTPIFKENAKRELGNLARTTSEQYGECLHQYTVKHAIHDKAVLGFKMDYQTTIPEEELDAFIDDCGLKSQSMTTLDKEKEVPRTMFDKDEHMISVVDAIVNKSHNKFNLKTTGAPYEALLTTSSIEKAQRYYRLFQELKKGTHAQLKLSDRTQSILAKHGVDDFPKVAITYSVSENEENSMKNQDEMKVSLHDYNEMFGTSFTIENMAMYNQNVNDRLARKKDEYQLRSNQLDIVIVVDRLLTGFDAPCMSTIFIDRPPKQPHELIQAFSRTNRLFEQNGVRKSFGEVVTFQTPELYKEAVDQAFKMYSNGGETVIQAPTWDESNELFKQSVVELKQIVAVPAQVDMLVDLAPMKRFAKAFQKFDKYFGYVQVYEEYEQVELENEYHISLAEIETYQGKYENIIEKIRALEDDPDDELLDFDITYQISSVRKEDIDYQYIVSLMQSFVLAEDELVHKAEIKQADIDEVTNFIEMLKASKPEKAAFIDDLWKSLQANPEAYRGMNIADELNDQIDTYKINEQKNFVNEWKVSEEELAYAVSVYNPRKNLDDQLGVSTLRSSGDYSLYKESTEHPVSKLKYGNAIKQNYGELVQKKLYPLED